MKTLRFALLFVCLVALPFVSARGEIRASSHGAATAVAGAATLNTAMGTITSESITTAAGAPYTLTLTNNHISTATAVLVTVDNGTNNTAGIEVGRITPGNGTATILVWNRHATAPLNGTLKISFVVVR